MISRPEIAVGTCEGSVVSLRGVSKSYVHGSSMTCVVNDVDLVVEPGKCVFLVGPSGSGKSTLLSMIGCVLTPDSGEVRIMGYDTRRRSKDEIAQMRLHHIGFVFQRFHLIRGLTVAENAALPLTLAGWGAAKALQRASELIEAVGLRDKLHVQPDRLSVGQCQRVAFARALVANPDLVLADEPTASLDAETGQQSLELLRQLTVGAGKTVIVVTHDPRILPFADRILRMENGRLDERTSMASAQLASVDRAHELVSSR